MNVTQRNRQGRPIPLIHNYCDRWCSSCAFVSRCGVALALEGKPECETVAEAVQHVQISMTQVVKLLREQVQRLSVPPEAVDHTCRVREPGVVDLDAARLKRVARTYAIDVARWLRVYRAIRPEVARRDRPTPDPCNPLDVIDWFSGFIGAKVHRALASRAYGASGADGVQNDANGSAKIASIGIERSLAAWRQLATHGAPEASTASAFIGQLESLATELARLFPQARHFVRPGFDAGRRRMGKGAGRA